MASSITSSNHSPILFEDENWFIAEKPIESEAGFPNTGLTKWLNLHLKKNLSEHISLDRSASGIVVYKKDDSQDVDTNVFTSISFLFICEESRHSRRYAEFESSAYTFSQVRKSNNHCLYHVSGPICASSTIIEIAAQHKLNILNKRATRNGRLYIHCHEVKSSLGEFTSELPDSFTFLLDKREPLLQEAALCWDRRLKWLSLITNAQRLIHRQEIGLPICIDIYNNYLAIAGFSQTDSSKQLQTKLSPVLDYLKEKYQWQGGLIRQHAQNPHKKRLIHGTVSFGKEIPNEIEVEESNLRYIVNINDSQHVGLFLDQRDSRKHLQDHANNKRVANLFSFTCSFSLAAVAAEAEVAFSIDLAGSTLNRGKDNFAINDLNKSGIGKFIKDDVCKWLTKQENKLDKNPEDFSYWDCIICDPPVYASAGKGRGFHVEKQWPELTRQCRRIMSENGIAIFANNHRGGKSDFYYNELKKQFKIVEKIAPPFDFPIIANQPEHVRIFWCQV